MEQTISLPKQSGMNQRKVKIIKIIAFSAFLLGIIYRFFLQERLFRYFADNELLHLSRYISVPTNILEVVTWLCLAFLAPNKPVRIMSCMMAFRPLFFYLSIFIPYPYWHFVNALICVLPIYFLSSIFSNISFSKEEKKWIMMLFLSHIEIVIFQIMLFLYQPSVWNIDFNGNGRLMNEWDSYQYFNSGMNRIYHWILPLFLIVGMYKLCFSKAFSSSYDKSAEGTYTPVNKYIIGALVTTIITCGLICLTLVFRHDIINLL